MVSKHSNQEETDLVEVQNFVLSLVLDSGLLLREEFKKRENLQEKLKGKLDFATQLDIDIDNFIIKKLKNRFPMFEILTEETAPDNYSRFQKFENLWVIDPIDGSTNFTRRRPHFAISIALVNKGVPKIAVVYLPMQDELYTARENTKSFVNGKEIRVSITDVLEKAWIESGLSWDMEKRREFMKWFSVLSQEVRAFTMSGSSVFDMAAVAKGQVDAFIYSGIKPWDQAAAGLLIQRSGGIITTFQGKPWNVFEEDIVASNGFLHNSLLELLNK